MKSERQVAMMRDGPSGVGGEALTIAGWSSVVRFGLLGGFGVAPVVR